MDKIMESQQWGTLFESAGGRSIIIYYSSAEKT